MKIKYINKGLIPALAVVLGLSSCLKDDNVQQDFTKLQPVTEITATNAGDGSPNAVSAGFISTSTSEVYNVDIHYAFATAPTSDVTVNFEVDPTLIDSYNSIKSGQDYKLLPSDKYTLTNKSVVIPAGSTSGVLPISFKPSVISTTESYALPLKITSVSNGVVSGNYGNVFIRVAIKNIYDGVYESKLHFVRVGLDERQTDVDKTLTTIDANTVSTLYADLGDTYTMELKVNPDNSVTITPTGAAADGTIPGPYTQVGVNKYDPATKTFTLHYQYRGGERTSEEILTLKQ